MPELAEVFARYGPAYLDRYGQAMLPSHRRAMQDILRCRTEAMGGQVFCCNRCGRTHYVYHSCRNRSCPKCHHEQTQDWLAQRRQELLPVGYFHLVFTVPQELHACLRSRQTELYSLFMQAAAQATLRLAADRHYVGGTVGILCVLHTWGRTLSYHPHLHCLVTGGGFHEPSHQWRPARPNYLVPVKALSRMVRDTFKDLLGSRLSTLNIPASVWRLPWNVNCQPVRGSTDNVLNYLGRYVHRIAITNNRILVIDDGRVTFEYQETSDQQWKRMTLEAEEFTRRFLQHVLPQGFHKVRYYGLWAPKHRPLLRRLQLLLAIPQDSCPRSDAPASRLLVAPEDPELRWKCPYCGEGRLVFAGLLHRRGRGPP
ncbi:MAG: IS91 family transposase [Phycisphaerae bacterium]|nr:IS91 family transposase [Phycisphaerae bacterium]